MKNIIKFLIFSVFILSTQSVYSFNYSNGVEEVNNDHLTSLLQKQNVKSGKKLTFKQKIALKIAKQKSKKDGESKSQLVALLLCIFVGTLGIHRFYLGYTTIGVIQLLTLGGLGIWTLIDLIRIITGDLKPKDGSDYDPTL